MSEQQTLVYFALNALYSSAFHSASNKVFAVEGWTKAWSDNKSVPANQI
jgi:hypothetical protein